MANQEGLGMTTQRRVLISGASIAGPATAYWLHMTLMFKGINRMVAKSANGIELNEY